MGGNMQPQGHMQTLVRMLDSRAAAAGGLRRAALAVMTRPRDQRRGGDAAAVVEEPARARPPRRRVNDSYKDFGAGQFIWRLGDPAVEGYVAASDSRRDGLAAGF